MVTRDRAMMDPQWQLLRASIKSIDSVTNLSPKPTAAGAGLGIRACHRKHPQGNVRLVVQVQLRVRLSTRE